LQQLESEFTQDISVNDAFKAVSRYWDRVSRPEQLSFTLIEAMRVLTSPANTGAVTLSLPQDVQTEAWDYPSTLFDKRVWHIARPMVDRQLLSRAVESIRKAKRPFLIAGGGIIYSDASRALASFVEGTGIPVGETMAGKGSLPYDHPQNLEALGVTGTSAANVIARDADLVIAVGTRLTDFTTASKTAFQLQDVQFININIAEFDAFKHAALPLVGDARVTLEEMTSALEGYRIAGEYADAIANAKNRWIAEMESLFALRHGPPISQLEVIDIVNSHAGPEDVVVCAAGSLPGDLHKLWRTRRPGTYHLEYGYSCMGYEIAGGLGVKMAAPEREVYVMVGDGSYLMMSSEIVTALQEGYKLIIILLDNHGFQQHRRTVTGCRFGRLRNGLQISKSGDSAAERRSTPNRLHRQCREPWGECDSRYDSTRSAASFGVGAGGEEHISDRCRSGQRTESPGLRVLVGCGDCRGQRIRKRASSAGELRRAA
jgi:3D-(3,5/4)-trihydroxycyclohexane-1,2-dione acylhydrolase (decyclizing)